MRHISTVFFFIAGCVVLLYLFTLDNLFCDNGFFNSRLKSDEMYDEWYDCMLPNMTYLLLSSPQVFWREIYKPVQYCEAATLMKELPMKSFTNSDETKWSLLPLKNAHHSEIVTIGVGQDTQAELELLKTLGASNVSFYGADPIVAGNQELYTVFGKFFPFAVGNSSDLANSSVLVDGNYITQSVQHVELLYFLKSMVKQTFFDNIWIDGEGAEYEIFDYFYNGGKLDENGITVCQFNLEMHQPDEARMLAIQNFLLKIFEDRRYAFFRPIQATHLRLYFVNFRDKMCIETYIP